jgi:hypothetical protein
MRRLFLRSAVVAGVIALFAPSLWFIVTGQTYKTPAVSMGIVEKMTPAQVEDWKRTNLARVSVWEHAKGTPQFIAENWVGYLEASAVVFVAVFGLNVAFHLVRGK